MSSKSVNPNNHSLSLAVKDIHASYNFYKKLGFTSVEGTGPIDQNWIILENGHSKIGLFQGMFDENIITFNPEDARSIYKDFKEQENIKFLMVSESLKEKKGLAIFVLKTPMETKFYPINIMTKEHRTEEYPIMNIEIRVQ